MAFWNWGPTTIWNNIEFVAFYLSQSLHPKNVYVHVFFIYVVHIYSTYLKENLNWKKKENDLKNSLHKLFFLDILYA